MPHQCVHCSKIIDAGSREILEGCSDCSGKFFFYIRDEQAQKIKEQKEKTVCHYENKYFISVKNEIEKSLDR